MKKKFLLGFIMALMLLLPFNFAKAEIIDIDKYDGTGLIETLESEGITPAYSDYKENNNQVTIYMFRGQGCPHCQEFLEYLNSISEEYGEKFKLRSFEVWNNTTNKTLMQKMGVLTENPSSGVPYIIIGEKVYSGYTTEWNDDILSTIEEEYNKKERFDYIERYNKEQMQDSLSNPFVTISVIIVGDIVIIALIVYLENKNKKEMIRHMNRLYKKLQSTNDNDSKVEEITNKDENLDKESNKKNK